MEPERDGVMETLVGRVRDDFLACHYRVANDSEIRFRLFVDACLAIGLNVFPHHSFSSFRLVSASSIRRVFSGETIDAKTIDLERVQGHPTGSVKLDVSAVSW